MAVSSFSKLYVKELKRSGVNMFLFFLKKAKGKKLFLGYGFFDERKNIVLRWNFESLQSVSRGSIFFKKGLFTFKNLVLESNTKK